MRRHPKEFNLGRHIPALSVVSCREGADRPHVTKPVEHMERETALAGAAVFIVCYCSISMIFGTICLRDRCSLL